MREHPPTLLSPADSLSCCELGVLPRCKTPRDDNPAKADCDHCDLLRNESLTGKGKEQEGRVEVQRGSFCQKQAPTCRGLGDIMQRSAAPQLKRRVNAETQEEDDVWRLRCSTCRDASRSMSMCTGILSLTFVRAEPCKPALVEHIFNPCRQMKISD